MSMRSGATALGNRTKGQHASHGLGAANAERVCWPTRHVPHSPRLPTPTRRRASVVAPRRRPPLTLGAVHAKRGCSSSHHRAPRPARTTTGCGRRCARQADSISTARKQPTLLSMQQVLLDVMADATAARHTFRAFGRCAAGAPPAPTNCERRECRRSLVDVRTSIGAPSDIVPVLGKRTRSHCAHHRQ